VEKNKAEVNIMGDVWQGIKQQGANGTGTTATFYKVTSRFVQLMLKYVNREKIHFSRCRLFSMTNLQAVELSVSLCSM